MMFLVGWILFGLIALWTIPPVVWFVTHTLKPLKSTDDQQWPLLSIIVPACNEAHAIDRALRSILSNDYPNLEVIAINDRSQDATGQIMDQVAADDSRCRVIHITELPDGWLGKNHAMHKASEAASGELLLFTDGDVFYEPGALKAAVSYLRSQKLDHLCLLPRMIPASYAENSVTAFFGMAFAIGQQVHLVRSWWPFSYVGVGAFNLLDAKFYRSFGGHQPIAMDVLDDVKLGKLVKRNKGQSDFMGAPTLLSIRWQPSFRGLITGLEKNGFAALGYSLIQISLVSLLFFATMIVPYFVPLFVPVQEASGFVAVAVLWHTVFVMAALPFGGSLALFPSFPFASVAMAFAFWRSAWITMRQQGVCWRGSFYPLKRLKREAYR